MFPIRYFFFKLKKKIEEERNGTWDNFGSIDFLEHDLPTSGFGFAREQILLLFADAFFFFPRENKTSRK